jgi:hypothetical protein
MRITSAISQLEFKKFEIKAKTGIALSFILGERNREQAVSRQKDNVCAICIPNVRGSEKVIGIKENSITESSIS